MHQYSGNKRNGTVSVWSDSVSVWRNTPPPSSAPAATGKPSLWPVCVFLSVCVMAVTALGRQRTFSGSWMPFRLSSGICTGPRRSLHGTWRAASSSCQATWLRTVSNGVFVCMRTEETSRQRMLRMNAMPNVLCNSVDKYFTCVAALGWHLSPSSQRAASRQISAFPQHCAPCSMWWWMPRTSLLNYVRWKWAKRYKHDGGLCVYEYEDIADSCCYVCYLCRNSSTPTSMNW